MFPLFSSSIRDIIEMTTNILNFDITESKQWEGIGPHPSYIETTRLFVLQPEIDASLEALGMTEARDMAVRLHGVAFIDQLRKAMKLPVKVFNTACVYFHRFRLDYADDKYGWQDASTAAVFAACKVEDIYKKAKEVACASHNLRTYEKLQPDDQFLNPAINNMLGLERLMLEASRFDFRTRHPQELVMILCKLLKVDKEVAHKAWNMTLDIHRTWTPLKQTISTMALAAIELAARLCKLDVDKLFSSDAVDWKLLRSPRHLVMETMNDLLELYTGYRGSTVVGKDHNPDEFVTIRLDLNRDPASRRLNTPHRQLGMLPDVLFASNTVASPATPQTPTKLSPREMETPVGLIASRGSATLRFVLDPKSAIDERVMQASYLKPQMELVEQKVWAVHNKTTGDWIDVRRGRNGLPIMNKDGLPLDEEGRALRIQNVEEVRKQLSARGKR